MLIASLFSQYGFMDGLAVLLVFIIVILISLSVHEFAHAYAAFKQGDQTARQAGRLTLNPVAHVSLTGFLMLLFVGFGWGKPVPFNPMMVRNKRFGPLLIALAGPLSNLIMAVFGGVIWRLLIEFAVVPPGNLLLTFMELFVILNVILMLFNLIPIPPLDGSKILRAIFYQPKYEGMHRILESQGPTFLIILLVLDAFTNVGIFSWLFNGVIKFVYRIVF